MFEIIEEKALSLRDQFWLEHGHTIDWVIEATGSEPYNNDKTRQGLWTDKALKRCPQCERVWEETWYNIKKLYYYDMVYGIYKKWEKCPTCKGE